MAIMISAFRRTIRNGLAILVVGALAASSGLAAHPAGDAQCVRKDKVEICVGDIVYPANGAIFGKPGILCGAGVAKMAMGTFLVPVIAFGGWGLLCLPEYIQAMGARVAAGLGSIAVAGGLASINACGHYATVTAVRQDDTIEIAYGIASYFIKGHRINISDVKVTR